MVQSGIALYFKELTLKELVDPPVYAKYQSNYFSHIVTACLGTFFFFFFLKNAQQKIFITYHLHEMKGELKLNVARVY